MKVKFELSLQALLRYDEECEVHVAWCPAVDVMSQGETEAEAREAIRDAVLLYVKHCYRRGILDNCLIEKGFNPADPDDIDADSDGDGATDRQYIKVFPYTDQFELKVPLHLMKMANDARGSQPSWLP